MSRRGKPGSVVDDAPTQLSLSMESRSQRQQHLIFRDLDAPLGHEFFVRVQRDWDRRLGDKCQASNPPILRIVDQFLPNGPRGEVVNDIADVVFIHENDADHGAGPKAPLI